MKNWIIVGILIGGMIFLCPMSHAAKVPGVTDKEIVIGNIIFTGGPASSGIA
jgi:hypothetical protein